VHTRDTARWTGLALVAALAIGGQPLTVRTLAAQPPAGSKPGADPWLRRAAPDALRTRPYEDPSKRFTIDYPQKDWTPYPGGVQALVTFHQKKGQASVVVERQTLPGVTEQRFVTDSFISLRADEVRNAEPRAASIEQRVIEDGEFRIAVLVYTRPGADGPESLRVYHMLRGRHLYRIVCRAVQGQMPAFEAIFAHMAASFSAPVAT
jgi:hypothetical protein